MPNFLIIGTAKAATTSLYHYLKQHPQIFMPAVKEPRFFAFENESLDFHGPADSRFKDQIITCLDDYCELFKGVTRETAIGEVSPVYLYSQKAPARIQNYIHTVKMIAILRDPVERAFSAFHSQIRGGREPLRCFSRAIEEEPVRIKNGWSYVWHYKQRGFYFEQICRYLEYFQKEQIRFFLFEDLKAGEINILKDIFRFLDVDDGFVPDIRKKYNVTVIPRVAFLAKFFRKDSIIRSLVKPYMPKMGPKLEAKVLNWNLRKPEIPRGLRSQLVQEFKEDILKLQDLIERDLSHWLSA